MNVQPNACTTALMIVRQAQPIQTTVKSPKKHTAVKAIWPISSLWLLFMLSSSVRD